MHRINPLGKRSRSLRSICKTSCDLGPAEHQRPLLTSDKPLDLRNWMRSRFLRNLGRDRGASRRLPSHFGQRQDLEQDLRWITLDDPYPVRALADCPAQESARQQDRPCAGYLCCTKKGLLTIADENGIVRRKSPVSCHHEIAKRPSDGCGTMRVLDLIWVRREAKYFCKSGSTGKSGNLPSGITRILPRRHGVGGADECATRSASSLAHPGRLLVRVKEGTKWRVPFGDGTQRVARC